MKGPSKMSSQPDRLLEMLVGGIVVVDGMDGLVVLDLASDGVEEVDEVLMVVPLHATADHVTLQLVERGEQGRGAVALVLMDHYRAFAALGRQARLSAINHLDLRLLVQRQDDGVLRRIDIEAHDIAQFGLEIGIAGALEASDAMGLQLMSFLDALDRAQRNPRWLGHRLARSVRRLMRRRTTVQCHNLRHHFGQNRRLAGLASFVMQQTFDPGFAEAVLPAPHHWPTHADCGSDLLHPGLFRRGKDNFGPQRMLLRNLAIGDYGAQLRALLARYKKANRLSRARRFAWKKSTVNPMNLSVH